MLIANAQDYRRADPSPDDAAHDGAAIDGRAGDEPASDADTGPPPDSLGAGAQPLELVAAPRFAVPILIVLGLLAYVANLGGYPFYTKGEPREAVTVFDIVHGGGVVLPMRAGVEIPSKPPMMHWMAALVSIAAGRVNEWTIRIPSATLAVLAILACYLYVRRLFDDKTAFLAAIIFGTSIQLLQAGSGARVDVTLTFFMEIAFFEFIAIAEGLTQRRMILYAAIAAAILSKGPVGAILPGLAAIVWIALERRWSVIRELRLWEGAALVFLTAGGWYLAATLVGGMPFVRKQILAENLFRFLHSHAYHAPHAHPFYYMELALLAGFMPWSLVIPIAAIQAIRCPRPLEPRLRYFLIWFATVLIFYNLPQSKRGVYLLALYPALATIIAIYLIDAAREPSRISAVLRVISRGVGGCFMAGASAGALATLVLVFSPRAGAAILGWCGILTAALADQLRMALGAHPIVAIAVLIALAASGAVALRADPAVNRLCGAIAIAMIAITLAVNLYVVPAIARTLTLKDFTTEVAWTVGDSSLGYMGALDYDFAYYSRRTIPVVSIWGGPLPEYLVGWREAFDALPAQVRARFKVVLTSNPTELDGSGGMLLLRVLPPGHPGA